MFEERSGCGWLRSWHHKLRIVQEVSRFLHWKIWQSGHPDSECRSQCPFWLSNFERNLHYRAIDEDQLLRMRLHDEGSTAIPEEKQRPNCCHIIHVRQDWNSIEVSILRLEVCDNWLLLSFEDIRFGDRYNHGISTIFRYANERPRLAG